MRSRSRIARAIRATASGISRMVSGSSRSSKLGFRKRRAAAGSESPRRTRTLAASVPIPRAPARAATVASSGAGNSQRAGALILGEIPAKRIAFVHIALGHGAGDLVFRQQELLVPVGLELVNVEIGIVVEGQFQGAGHTFVNPQLAQARLMIALLLAI